MCPQEVLQELPPVLAGPPKGKVEARAIIGEKGRVVLPASIREALGLKAGDVLDIVVENHELRASTRWNRMKRAQERAQRFYGPGRSLADELIAERRAEAIAESSE